MAASQRGLEVESTTAVIVGGRTASRSARSEESAEVPSSMARTRYWGNDRSTVPSPIPEQPPVIRGKEARVHVQGISKVLKLGQCAQR